MGCATGMVKYIVFIFNLVFAIAGLALLVIGILFKIQFNDITQNIENKNFALAPTLVIIVGSIIFVIAFFGCCGAVKESSCMLTTYAVILLAIFILQVAVGVFAFLEVKNEDDLKSKLRGDLEKAYSRYHEPNVAEGVDLLQQTLKCCGVDSGPNSFPNHIPKSCCGKNKDTCDTTDNTYYEHGCAQKLFMEVKTNVKILGYVALGISATEIIGAIFALCLTSSIRNERRRNYG